MTATPKVLIAAQDVPNATTTLYTSPAAASGGKGTWIDKFTAHNHTAGAVALTIYLVPSGGAAADSNKLIAAAGLAAGATDTLPEVVGKFLNPGDFIAVLASAAASISVAANGRELV